MESLPEPCLFRYLFPSRYKSLVFLLFPYVFYVSAGSKTKTGPGIVSLACLFREIILVFILFFELKLKFLIFPMLNRAMLELDQILKANEINFAVLAALPAFF